jgi:hypothetical protein
MVLFGIPGVVGGSDVFANHAMATALNGEFRLIAYG